MLDELLDLDRTFHAITLGDDNSDDSDLANFAKRRGELLRWPDLLKEPRVILLSEAGAGKTTEIREVARRLRREGKHAFFMRLEHVADDVDQSFEEGTIQEFNTWLASAETGWLFLDSVDEARLKHPKDFERALRQIGRLLGPALQRARVVITGRTHAWRPQTDLLLCNAQIPYRENEAPASGGGSVDDSEGSPRTPLPDHLPSPYKIVALDDLHGDQIDVFLSGKGVRDAKAFKDAVERRDVSFLTARPKDLSELVDFWKALGQIGSRLDLMRNSLARRLEERDQDRADARPIAADRLRTGARLVAAATTLGQHALVRVPDGSENSRGMPVRELLSDWTDTDVATLLSRPIFDEGIYGTVRFHHRSVREYLTAEWLGSLLARDGSRGRIEGLFFRSQYGMDVIVPAMRPVLPWLALFDERILKRVREVEPEVLFEGGDPSQLPYDTRSAILRDACERLTEPGNSHSVTDLSAIQLFASSDLSADVLALLRQYHEDDNLTSFLLRMVWQGQLRSCAAEAKRIAIESRNRYTRVSAVRALSAVASRSELAEVRDAMFAESGPLDRDCVAELVRGLPHDESGLKWLLDALERTKPKKRFSVDRLSTELSELATTWPTAMLASLVEGISALLGRTPYVEVRHCEISARFCWLAQPASESVARLIEERAPSALSPTTQFVLRQLPNADDYREHSFGTIREELPKLVAEWPELNRVLFWYDVARTRVELESGDGESLTEFWRVGPLNHYWSFSASDFDSVCEDIRSRTLTDDRLVAMTLAFAIYARNRRPKSWLKRLHQLAESVPLLQSTLQSLLHPPPSAIRLRRQQARWKRQTARDAAARRRNEEAWKASLAKDVGKLRDSGKTDSVTQGQWYLLNEMRGSGDLSGKWSDNDWHSLEAKFGEPVARAFRDGAVAFWRTHRPKLRSDGVAENTTPVTAIFGLVGLSIEASEDPDLMSRLSKEEAILATRFALHELNGFPSWFASLYSKYPEEVISVVLGEVDHELAHDDPARDSHYVLDDVGWSGDWMWNRIAGAMVTRLETPPANVHTLRTMIGIVQGSSLTDEVLARLASEKAKSTRDSSSGPLWFAMWVGAEPAVAIPFLAARLAELEDDEAKDEFAMRFITALIGGRRERATIRQAFRSVEFMKDLYLLMNKHIRESDRLEEEGLSSGLRSDAADAKHALLSFIVEKPGKEAFLALIDISRAHPTEALRHRIASHAKEKAAVDSNGQPWVPAQVREFNDRLECAPSNHRDLWDLAVDQLMNLKHDLEDGDASLAGTLLKVEDETEIRTFIGNWCRQRSRGRFSIPQEEELADARRPDLRFHGAGFDAPVPTELKIADKWTGPNLFERLENQLCNDYLRDIRSNRGIFCLVYRGSRASWDLPSGGRVESFDALVNALREHWVLIASRYAGVEDISIVGIDLTKRKQRRVTLGQSRGDEPTAAKKNASPKKAAKSKKTAPKKKATKSKSAPTPKAAPKSKTARTKKRR